MPRFSYEPDPLLFRAEPRFPPHAARMLTPEELASISGHSKGDSERQRFDAVFSAMQDRHARDRLWCKVELVALSICLVGLGAIGAAAILLLRV